MLYVESLVLLDVNGQQFTLHVSCKFVFINLQYSDDKYTCVYNTANS